MSTTTTEPKNWASLRDVKRIIVKWNFTSPDRVPKGIRLVDRQEDVNEDLKQIEKAQAAGLNEKRGEIGRIRPERVDTGYQFVEDVSPINALDLLAKLAAMGWEGVDPCYYVRTPTLPQNDPRRKQGRRNHNQKGRGGRTNKFVVCVNYVKRSDYEYDGKTPTGANLTWLHKDQARALSALVQMSWHVHCYKNPDGTLTVNFVQMMPNDKPRFTFDVTEGRDGRISVVPVD